MWANSAVASGHKFWVLGAVCAAGATTGFNESWPNPIAGYTNGDRTGDLPGRDAVDRDFRHFYRLVTLELLLLNRGFPRHCKAGPGNDPRHLSGITAAVKDFQRSSPNLTMTTSRLDAQFWKLLVVPIKPGDQSAAVLALKWLISASQQASRPPLWDSAEIDRHRCQAFFSSDLEHRVVLATGVAPDTLRQQGVSAEIWLRLLQLQEVRACAGCTLRSRISRIFGIIWVVTWFVIVAAFATSHTDGWNHGPGTFQTPPSKHSVRRLVREISVLLAMMVAHHLAVIGVWSFDSDIMSHLLVGWLFTAAAVVAVRLAAVRGKKTDEKYWVRLVEVVLFSIGNIAIYYLILAFDNMNGLEYVILQAIMMVFWGIVTSFITDQNRIERGGLLLVMCVFAAALPSLLVIGANKVDPLVLAFAPSYLFVLAFLSEGVVGQLIVKHCEYTAETQWLLATVFRLCIELVRFNTALAVLLLTRGIKLRFGLLAVHLAQSLLFEVIKQIVTHRPTENGPGIVLPKVGRKFTRPFTAAEIVVYVGSHPWAYRSRAVMLPIEVVLFLTHLCQLAFVGMPVQRVDWLSDSQENDDRNLIWWAGLALMAFAMVLREAVIWLVSLQTRAMTPRIPWSQLPGHLIALMVGVGMIMSTFAEVHFLWLMYAHHWAACFYEWVADGDVKTVRDTQVGGPIIMALVGLLVLCINIFSFFNWTEWVVSSAKVHPIGPGQVVLRSSSSLQGKFYDEEQASGTLPILRQTTPVEPVDHDQLGSTGEEQGLLDGGAHLSREWDETLNSLWQDPDPSAPNTVRTDQELSSRGRSSQGPKNEAVDLSAEEDEWIGATRVSSKDLHLRLADELLQVVKSENDERDERASKAVHTKPPIEPTDEIEHDKLLKEVLMEMPSDTREDSIVAAVCEPLSPDYDIGWSIHDADVSELLGAEQGLRAAAVGSTPALQPDADMAGEGTLPSSILSPASGSALSATVAAVANATASPMATGTLRPGQPERILLNKTVEFQEVDQLIDALENSDGGIEGTLGALPLAGIQAKETPLDGLSTAIVVNESLGAKASLDFMEDLPESIQWEMPEKEKAEKERLEREAKERAEQQAREKAEREASELAEKEAQEKAEREAREKSEREAREKAEREAREKEEREARERAEREAREKAEREERERKEREERETREKAEREAAERREAARVKLASAVSAWSREDIEICLVEARANGVSDEDIKDAEKTLSDIIDEEKRNAAQYRLAEACKCEDVDELNLAIGHAKDQGVSQELVLLGVERLDDLIAQIARNEAAGKQLREAMSYAEDGSHHALNEKIKSLEEALSQARSARVAASELTLASDRLQILVCQRRRDEAVLAMAEALASHDIEQVKLALLEARAADVDAGELARVERALQDLIEEIDLAHNKERLLFRRVEHLVAAKNEAELAEASSTVEEMLADPGVLSALREAIQDARKTRMVKKSSIQKADAVLLEVTADLKRILADKKAQEKRIATEILRNDMDRARHAEPKTHLVCEALQEAIAAARIFHAETKEAEALLQDVTAENKRLTKEAQETLDQGLQDKDPANVKKGIGQCRPLLLNDSISRALSLIRDIISEDLNVAREQEREERLQSVAKLEAFMSVLRANGDKQLRQFHNQLQDLKGALRVFCRVRPLNSRETKKGDHIAVDIPDAFTVVVTKPDNEKQVFNYDTIFGPTTTQSEVFYEVKSLVQSAMDGYNITIFSYGQTGAGKTWTLYGSGSEHGVSPRTCEEVFRFVHRDSERLDIGVKASMVELYNDHLRDLLNTAKKPPKLEFKMYKQPDGQAAQRLEGAIETQVASSEDLAKVVATGLGNRKVRGTDMNAQSSRSHLLLTIHLNITEKASGRSRAGKITIVDLAGSERLAKSGATGDAQKEAIEINKSLTALGDVMMAFTSKAKLIPYRNSKLTQLMQDSLGGTAKTLMFVNISPANSNAEETINALKYASRARCIENDVQVHRKK